MADPKTVPDGDNATPKQDTQKEKKFAEKYQSVEELEKAHKEAEARIAEMGDKLARTEELLNVYMSSYAQVPTAENQKQPQFTEQYPQQQQTAEQKQEDYFNKLQDNPREVFDRYGKDLENRIVNRIVQLYQSDKTQQSVYSYFYGKYPELREHQPIVGFIANRVQQENPTLQLPQLLDKVAQQTKEYLGKIRQGSQPSQPAVVLTGGSTAKEAQTAAKQEPEIEKLLTEEERLQQSLTERAEQRKKFLVK